MYQRAEGLVRSNWGLIDDVAQGLIRDKTLSERQVLRIVRDHFRFNREIEVMMTTVKLLLAQHSAGLLPTVGQIQTLCEQIPLPIRN